MTDKAIDTSPGHNDVLFGIGIGFQNHVGNTRFRNLISGCLEKYDKTSERLLIAKSKYLELCFQHIATI
jgi:hypothetical protein